MLEKVYHLVKPTDPASFWTMVLALGTVALALVAWRGLRSLGLTKTDMLTRAQRDARACAIARCEEMALTILPKNGELLTAMGGAGIKVFVQAPEAVQFDPDNAKDLALARQWCAALPRKIHLDSIEFVNRVEAWAMHFTSRVADQEIAFGPCAIVFCMLVVQFYAILLARRASGSSGQFPNTVELFKRWLRKLESEKDGKRMQELITEVQNLQKKHASQPPLPPALGTHVD